MTVVTYDYQEIKHEVVQFLEVDENWNNVVKLLGWENKTFMAHDLYNTLTDLYMEGINGIYTDLQEGQKVEYSSIAEYVAAWIDGDF